MNKTSQLLTVAMAGLGLLAGCRDVGSEPNTGPVVPLLPPGSTVSFQQNVTPILTRYGCTGCHGGSGGLHVGTVSQLKAGGNHGPAVTPGNASASLIMKKLSEVPPFGTRMPEGGPYLPDSVQQVIGTWINQGANEN